MARFYGSMQGDRGKVTRCGTRGSGIEAHIRGWEVGVRVVGKANDLMDGKKVQQEADEFEVWATGGSNNRQGPLYLGTVRLSETDGTIQFFKE